MNGEQRILHDVLGLGSVQAEAGQVASCGSAKGGSHRLEEAPVGNFISSHGGTHQNGPFLFNDTHIFRVFPSSLAAANSLQVASTYHVGV